MADIWDGYADGCDLVGAWPDALPHLADRFRFAQVLVIGDADVDLPAGAEARRIDQCPGAPRGLVAGLDRTANTWWAVVSDGDATGCCWASQITEPLDSPLTAGQLAFTRCWPGALPIGRPPARFSPGDFVVVTGTDGYTWVVQKAEWMADAWRYTLRRDQALKEVVESSLLPAPDPDDLEAALRLPPRGAEDLSLRLTHVKLANTLTDVIYSRNASKTVYQPYQFRPLLRLLRSPVPRLLLADEVGLGKTIEAGLIWTELDHRVGVDKGLVVCPSTLTHKWADEFERRFDRELRILGRSDLDEMVERWSKDDDHPINAVVSLELLRSYRRLDELANIRPHFDLVVVDEAHYMRNSGRRSFLLGQMLGDWADVLLFLSATPVNLGDGDLFNLLSLMSEDLFPDRLVFSSQLEPNTVVNAAIRQLRPGSESSPRDVLRTLDRLHRSAHGDVVTRRPEYALVRRTLERDTALEPAEAARTRDLLGELNVLSSVVNRTRKADVPGKKIHRDARNVPVEWTPAELAAYREVYRWAVRKAREERIPLGFALQMPLRQAASCLPALRQLLHEKEELDQAEEDLDDLTVTVDDGDARHVDARELRRDLGHRLSALTVDTKLDRLLDVLADLRRAGARQVMIFSFFKRTLRYLERQLRDRGETVEVMNGDVKMPDRIDIMRRFRRGDFDVLLLSEVGSEGLDFEFCQAIVNYDLPWNPMRVEQRIGRLDRFGSPHEKIFVVNFHIPGTIETDIFERLYDRIGIFERSIGELEPILQEVVEELTSLAFDPSLSTADRERERRRIEEAFELRAKVLADIQDHEAEFAGVDHVPIEGLEREDDGEGRVITEFDLRRIVDHVLARTGARLRTAKGSEIHELIGDDDLAELVRRSEPRVGGSIYGLQRLQNLLRDGQPVLVTFRPERASREGVDLLGIRHPVVRAAIDSIEDRDLARFASVRLPGDAAQPGSYLVGFWLLEITGVRPRLEVRALGLDLGREEFSDTIGDRVLAAAAQGELRDGPVVDGEALIPAWRRLREQFTIRSDGFERAARESNEAVVDAQIVAQAQAFDLKIRRARQQLALGGGESIERLHRGRIRNLEGMKQDKLLELERCRALGASVTPVAAIAVEVGES